MQGSKDVGNIKSVMDGRMDGQAKSNMPPQSFFKFGE